VIRPMWYEYPEDSFTNDLEKQMMVGSSILVAPLFNPSEDRVQVYIPYGTQWYILGKGLKLSDEGIHYSQIKDHDMAPVYVKAGSIIPTRP